MVPRPVSAVLHTRIAGLLTLLLVLAVSANQTVAQRRTTRLNASPANTLEAAVMEFALNAEEVEQLIGKTADITASNGKAEQGVEITRFLTGRDKSQIKSIEVKAPNATRSKRLLVTRLDEMKVEDKLYQFQYLPSIKAALLEDLSKKNAAISEKLKASNEEFWEEIPEEEQLKYVNEYKEFLDKVGKHYASFNMKPGTSCFIPTCPPTRLPPTWFSSTK